MRPEQPWVQPNAADPLGNEARILARCHAGFGTKTTSEQELARPFVGGLFKRGMRVTYTLCGEQHLQRYLTEFQFRYNNRSGLGISDGERTATALKGIERKHLTYRPTY